MKKIAISLVLVVLLASVLSIPVFATEMDMKTSTVRASTDTDVWEWSIPTYIDVDGSTAGSTGGANIEVSITTLTPGKVINVQFRGSENNFKLVRAGSPAAEVAYSLYCGGNSITENPSNIATGITSYTAIPLCVTLDETISVTGNYSDVLSFGAFAEIGE